ncbi:dnaJ homolog subfamily C member 15-like [Ptychodera flava]|uniref:dnaJ homolog subfamily C member 15-like n=1 Tax=Ptychodera flava TaxID=63121 RepID=UPI00396A3E95
MSGSVILAGLGLVAVAVAGRAIVSAGKVIQQNASKIPTPSLSAYYRGGFDIKMTRREASLILGISPSATKPKVRQAHRRIMLLNHPDRGGSPYIAAKINEAKDLLEKNAKGK